MDFRISLCIALPIEKIDRLLDGDMAEIQPSLPNPSISSSAEYIKLKNFSRKDRIVCQSPSRSIERKDYEDFIFILIIRWTVKRLQCYSEGENENDGLLLKLFRKSPMGI